MGDRAVCECLFLMRSERASRVCIVVLEEVEEDETCSSSPPPRPKSSPDRRSHDASRKVAAQDDKVRRDLLLSWCNPAFAESSNCRVFNERVCK